MKYTVPPDTFVPLGVVGSVRPGPRTGLASEDGVASLAPPALLELDDPQAVASSTTAVTPMDATSARVILCTFSSSRRSGAMARAWGRADEPPMHADPRLLTIEEAM